MSLVVGMLLLAALLIFGAPIAIAMAAAGFVGLVLEIGLDPSLAMVGSLPFTHSASFLLTTVPMFVLMAEFLANSRISADLFNACSLWLSRIRGGLAMATIVGGAGFGALAGSSTASSGALSAISVPRMREAGYSDQLSSGATAAAGTLAVIIPPSIPLIIYGVQTETSIRDLFAAGIVPGLLTAGAYICLVYFRVKRRPSIAPMAASVPWSERLAAATKLLPAAILVLLVLGGIYSGAVTATEAGALGAVGALVVSWLWGGLRVDSFRRALQQTVQLTAMILIIVGGAAIFGAFVATTRVAATLFEALDGSGLSPVLILALVVVVCLILGTFLDQLAVLLLTLPLMFPLIDSLGYDAVWFGIILVKTVEIGLLTPPVGMNVYVTASSASLPSSTVFRGASWFVLADALVLVALIVWPQLVLLPLAHLGGG